MWPFDKKAKPNKTQDYSQFRMVPLHSRGDFNLINSESIFAAVSRISYTLGCLPLRLYDGYNVKQEDARNMMFVRGPNDYMTTFEFFSCMEAYRNTEGNAYALMVPSESGGLHHLDIIDAARVEPMLEKNSRELWYSMRADDGTLFYVHHANVIAVKHLCTNGYKGIRPVDVLRDSLSYDDKIRSFNLRHLENGVNASIALEIPTDLSESKKSKAVSDFLKAYRESGGSLIVLDGGMKANRLERSPVDSKALDTERITRNRVATVYNIPPHMLGDYTGSSFQTMEQQMLEFLQLTMLPICKMYEQELNKKLLTAEELQRGLCFRFDMNTLMQGDISTRGEYNFKMIRSAGRTPNEIRAEEGKPPKPGGDKLYVSRDLISIDDLPTLNGGASGNAE